MHHDADVPYACGVFVAQGPEGCLPLLSSHFQLFQLPNGQVTMVLSPTPLKTHVHP